MPTRARAAELVVRAVADEEAVGRLDVERARRAEVDLGLRLHQAALRPRRSPRRRGRRARSAATRPAPPPSRPRARRASRRGGGASRGRRVAPGRGRSTRRRELVPRGDLRLDSWSQGRRARDRRRRAGRSATAGSIACQRRRELLVARRRRAPPSGRAVRAASSAGHSTSVSQRSKITARIRAAPPTRRGRRPRVVQRVADREPDHAAPRASSSRRRSARTAVARRAISSLSALSCRKQTVENGRGAEISQPGSARTHSSNSAASRTCSRISACSPSRP